MAAAADLLEAANITQSNLFALWLDDTLQAKVIAFCAALNGQFEEQTPNERPILNWLAIIAAFAPTIQDYVNAPDVDGIGTEDTFQEAVDYVYRFCKFSYYYSLITPAQQTTILTAYNAQFA